MKHFILSSLAIIGILSSLFADKPGPVLIKQKMAQLDSEDWILKTEAIKRLGDWKHEAALKKIESIYNGDKNHWIKGQALKSIAQISKSAAKSLIEKSSKNSDAVARRFAFEALAITEDESLVAHAQRALKDTDPSVQIAALSALTAINKNKSFTEFKNYFSKKAIPKGNFENAIRAAISTNNLEALKIILTKLNANLSPSDRFGLITAIREKGNKDHISFMIHVSSKFSVDSKDIHMFLNYYRSLEMADLQNEILKGFESKNQKIASHVTWLSSKIASSEKIGSKIAEILKGADISEEQIELSLKALSNPLMQPAKYQKTFETFISHKNKGIQRFAISCLALCPDANHLKHFKPIMDKSPDLREHILDVLIRKEEDEIDIPDGGLANYIKALVDPTNDRLLTKVLKFLEKFGEPEDVYPIIKKLGPQLLAFDSKDRFKLAAKIATICDDSGLAALSDAQGYLSHWMVIGTFILDGKSLEKKQYAPDSEIDFKKTYKSKYHWTSGYIYSSRHRNRTKKAPKERNVQWRYFGVGEYQGILRPSMATPPPHNSTIAYCVTDIVSDKEQEVFLDIKADDQVIISLNGEKVVDIQKPQNSRIRTYIRDTKTFYEKATTKKVKVKLKKGINRFFVKSANHTYYWGFSIRCLDEKNNVLRFKSGFDWLKEKK